MKPVQHAAPVSANVSWWTQPAVQADRAAFAATAKQRLAAMQTETFGKKATHDKFNGDKK